MRDQISEEFAKELLNVFVVIELINEDGIVIINEYNINKCRDVVIDQWKQKGYIKQSREDEIREELKRLYDDRYNLIASKIEDTLQLQRELIEILEAKNK